MIGLLHGGGSCPGIIVHGGLNLKQHSDIIKNFRLGGFVSQAFITLDLTRTATL